MSEWPEMCFGCSGGFGPMSLPLFQGLRRGVTVLALSMISMVLLPFARRRPRMLSRRKRGPTHVRYQSEAVTMHRTAGWAGDASDPKLPFIRDVSIGRCYEIHPTQELSWLSTPPTWVNRTTVHATGGYHE